MEKLQTLLKNKVNSVESFYEYYKVYGLDEFVKDTYMKFIEEPLVGIINVDCNTREIEMFFDNQVYKNMILMGWNNIDDLSKCEYFCFIENKKENDACKILDMVLKQKINNTDIIICYRDFLIEDDIIIKDVTYKYWRQLQDVYFEKAELLKICVKSRINLYGGLSNFLIKRDVFDQRQIMRIIEEKSLIYKMKIIFDFLLNGTSCFLNKVYVIEKIEKSNDNSEIMNILYLDYVKSIFGDIYKEDRKKINKKITFFYTDRSEVSVVEPIAKYAEAEGYEVKFTEDLQEKADIGIYCQHICYPENSKLSFIMLHDMAQGHNIWPNIWKNENWDKFDYGILPGREWENRWGKCALVSYARPRKGNYVLGAPKADAAFDEEILSKAKCVKADFKYSFTVLYAPSWENDGKEDDFIKALCDLPVNLIVKQAHLAPQFQNIIDNIKYMRSIHEGKYDNLTYIEPEETIMVALASCDLVVSDESSVMAEATLYGIPSIAITDWLIPDSVPSRFASVPMDYVIKCKKDELKKKVLELLNDKHKYQKASRLCTDFFINKGECCADILKIIEAELSDNKIPESIKEKQAKMQYECIDMWN
ncbi:MAG: hypothetical protein J6C99_10790 [Lachnospiraceae bacterium]|nr:hypothetical protein [Lachnospiraceae bacterium]